MLKINLLKIPVFYINMTKDTNKNEYLSSKLKELGFESITRIDAIQDKKGIIGLSKSQNLALSQIRPPFIILEDDCDPKYFTPEIEVPEDADAVYLGNSPWGRLNGYHGLLTKTKKINENTYRVFNMLSSHAILYLTDSYVDICKRTTRYCIDTSNIPMDVPFADIQKYYNVYVFDKPHFIQKEYSGSMTNASQWTGMNVSDFVFPKTQVKASTYLFNDKIV